MAKKKRRRLRWGRIFFVFFLFIFLIVSLVGIGAYKVIEYRLNHGENTYIAIIGTDEREGQEDLQRSDVLMLAAVNFDTSKVHLLSIPRDSLVDIPCKVDLQDKITHAYHYGGRDCTLDALEELFAIDEIQTYVQVNFESVIALVDDLGGITLTPSKTFSEYNVHKTELYTFEKGKTMEMDGAQALAYCRHRKSDSDIYRTQRQQEVLMAMLTKVRKMKLIDIFNLGKKVLNEVDTNMDIMEALTYFKLTTRDDFTLFKTSAKGSDYYYNGVYYYRLNDAWLQETIENIKQTK